MGNGKTCSSERSARRALSESDGWKLIQNCRQCKTPGQWDIFPGNVPEKDFCTSFPGNGLVQEEVQVEHPVLSSGCTHKTGKAFCGECGNRFCKPNTHRPWSRVNGRWQYLPSINGKTCSSERSARR